MDLLPRVDLGAFYFAGSGTRTRTDISPGDFKSPAYANSAIPAFCFYKYAKQALCQYDSEVLWLAKSFCSGFLVKENELKRNFSFSLDTAQEIPIIL